MSSGFFWRRAARPVVSVVGLRCESTEERRWVADAIADYADILNSRNSMNVFKIKYQGERHESSSSHKSSPLYARLGCVDSSTSAVWGLTGGSPIIHTQPPNHTPQVTRGCSKRQSTSNFQYLNITARLGLL